MNPLAIALFITLSVTTAGKVTVTKSAEPEKALDFEIVVPASLHDAWLAMTTSAGLATWIAPEGKVDLRPGGDWLAMFPGAAPGGGTIVDVVPEQRLSIRAMAPEKFPNVRSRRTLAVFTFATVDERNTRIHLRQTGWEAGEEWDQAYEYLSQGNAQLLNALWRRFANGPVDWLKVLAK